MTEKISLQFNPDEYDVVYSHWVKYRNRRVYLIFDTMIPGG